MARKVSVVMPVYRNRDSLKESVHSLLKQDFDGQIEVILCFDDPQDGTREVIDELMKEYPSNIRLIEDETPMGLGKARKKAIPYLDGDYVYSLDADDIMLPGALKAMVNDLESSGADCLNASFYLEDGGKQKPYRWSKKATYDSYGALKALLGDISFRSFLWAKLFRAELFKKRPLSLPCVKATMFEDLPLSASLLMHCKKVVCVTYPVVSYRLNVATSNTSKPKTNRAIMHLAAFASTRQVLEGDEKALNIFLKKKWRTKLSIDYDLSCDKKGGANDDYVKMVKREFKHLFEKGKLDYQSLPYYEFIAEALILA